MKKNPDTSRRNFLELAGLAASTGALGALGHAASALNLRSIFHKSTLET